MNKEIAYPILEVDLSKLKKNLAALKERCRVCNIDIMAVVKGFSAIPEIVEIYDKFNFPFIASSRLDQLKILKDYGIQTRLAHIRIGMQSEVYDIVEFSDLSLQSEISTLKKLNEVACEKNKIHEVLLMADIGDLREGYWDKEELSKVAYEIENDLNNLHLAGIGTNVGCYGSIKASYEKLMELVEACQMVEQKIGRKLDIISGGASSSMMTLLDGKFPERINNLRLGEIIPFGLSTWGYDYDVLYDDIFVLKAEVIELKKKPSYPVGERSVDAFGNVVEYEDIGEHMRALVAVGKVDYGDPFDLIPLDEGIKVIGASSDHTILDVTKSRDKLEIGSIVEFKIQYSNCVYLTNTNSVGIKIK